MFPSRFVRSCSGILDVVIINIEEEGGIYDGIGNCNWNGEDLDDENDDCNDDHLNEKLFYEIFGHGVDVARPVYLPASKKKGEYCDCQVCLLSYFDSSFPIY